MTVGGRGEELKTLNHNSLFAAQAPFSWDRLSQPGIRKGRMALPAFLWAITLPGVVIKSKLTMSSSVQ